MQSTEKVPASPQQAERTDHGEELIQPRLLLSPIALLFQHPEGLIGSTDLPFIDEENRWCQPPFSTNAKTASEAMEEDSSVCWDFGRHAAAAYFIHLQRGDSAEPLFLVLKAMFDGAHRSTQISFCGYLQRLLWLHGQEVSASAVASDVAAIVAEDRAREAEDAEDLASSREADDQ